MRKEDKTLSVLIGGEAAGTLSQLNGGALEFVYLDDYDGVDLSLSMPKGGRRFSGPRVKAFFAGLLPDDAGVRKELAARYGVSPSNPFALLRHVGMDCPGAVQICPQDEVEIAKTSEGELVPLDECRIAGKLRCLEAGSPKWVADDERWTLGGAQAKFAVRQQGSGLYECRGAQPTNRILKPGVLGLQNQTLDEYVCLKAAEKLGLRVERLDCAAYDGELALVIERFDRASRLGGDAPTRLHQEDLCQALGYEPSKKYASDGGPGAAEIARRLAESGPHSKANVERFVDAFIFNDLTASTDAHAKNHALLYADGSPEFAPLYDVASMLPYWTNPCKPIKLAMGMGGENKAGKISRKNISAFCKAANLDAVGITAEAIAGRFEELAQAVPDAMREALGDARDISGVDELAHALIPGVEKICDRQLSVLARR